MGKCQWCLGDDVLEAYHDTEWGRPQKDDRLLFEALILEAMQAGLSWQLILKKRAALAKAFYDYDLHKLAELSDQQLEAILKQPEVIKSLPKIRAVRQNAQAFLRIQKEFGSFANYLWSWTDDHVVVFEPFREQSKHELSVKFSKDLKKRGFLFIGPVTGYSFLQAVGVINDHEPACPYRHLPEQIKII